MLSHAKGSPIKTCYPHKGSFGFLFCIDKSNHMDIILQSLPESRNAHVFRKEILLYFLNCNGNLAMVME